MSILDHYWTKCCIASVGLIALAVLTATGAAANNFTGANGATGCAGPNKGDTSLHTFYYDNLSNQVTQAGNAARNQDIEDTDVNTELLSSSSASTDVIVRDDYYSGSICGIPWSNIVGYYSCEDTNSQSECETSFVRFNMAAIDNMSDQQDRSAACHEFGHSLGLEHRNPPGDAGNGCMTNGAAFFTGYTGHDKDHLNNAY